MPDSPDFQKYLPGSVRFSLQDMGELAIRLGSSMVYDRRGEVLWWDTFAYGINNYIVNYDGSGGYMRLVSYGYGRWPYQMFCYTGSGGGKYIYFSKTLNFMGDARMGFEAVFGLGVGWSQFDNNFVVQRDAVVGYPSLRLLATDGKLQVRDNTDNYVDIATGLVIPTSTSYLINTKIVIDTINRKYIRVIYGTTEYDVSNISYLTSTGSLSNLVVFYLRIQAIAFQTTTLSVTQLLLTGNEP